MIIDTKKGGKGAVVRFIEGSVSKFVEKDGAEELRIARGKETPLSRRKLLIQLRKIATVSKQYRLKHLQMPWSEVRALAAKDISDKELGEQLAVALHMANFEFVRYKKEPKDGFSFIDKVFVRDASREAAEGIARGAVIAAEVNACRELANTPGGDMTPKILAAAAKQALKGTKATLKILGEKEMKKQGFGAVLGMAKGSSEEPQFIIAEYWGSSRSKKPLVLIGKGVTFDSGGLNVKPGDSMLEMHMDMSGGAAVIHAVALAAKLKLKTNVVGLVPAIENMSGGSAIRPGDIVVSLSGRTIEVLNTDAEGRVILADAITYAKRYEPVAVAECSTLTGAALTALGLFASGLMTKDEAFQKTLMELGEKSGEYLWPFPLWEEYEDMIKGNFGDVSNIPAQGNTRYAGVIGGGMFLQEFAKDLSCPFAHLDIAPRMTPAPGEQLSKGAIGTPVRLFLSLIEHFS